LRPSYLWVIPIACAWPAAAFGVTFARFGRLPVGDGYQNAAAVEGFFLVGVLSGSVLVFVLRRTASRPGRILGVAGYALAAPFGYLFGVLGPLPLEVFDVALLPNAVNYLILFPLAIGLYGSLPLIIGAVVGSWIGSAIGRAS
jgi:hypothetical protein